MVHRIASKTKGRFPFNKNSGLKFRKLYVLNGTVHSGCTDPTQATARFVIVASQHTHNYALKEKSKYCLYPKEHSTVEKGRWKTKGGGILFRVESLWMQVKVKNSVCGMRKSDNSFRRHLCCKSANTSINTIMDAVGWSSCENVSLTRFKDWLLRFPRSISHDFLGFWPMTQRIPIKLQLTGKSRLILNFM